MREGDLMATRKRKPAPQETIPRRKAKGLKSCAHLATQEFPSQTQFFPVKAIIE